MSTKLLGWPKIFHTMSFTPTISNNWRLELVASFSPTHTHTHTLMKRVNRGGWICPTCLTNAKPLRTSRKCKTNCTITMFVRKSTRDATSRQTCCLTLQTRMMEVVGSSAGKTSRGSENLSQLHHRLTVPPGTSKTMISSLH